MNFVPSTDATEPPVGYRVTTIHMGRYERREDGWYLADQFPADDEPLTWEDVQSRSNRINVETDADRAERVLISWISAPPFARKDGPAYSGARQIVEWLEAAGLAIVRREDHR